MALIKIIPSPLSKKFSSNTGSMSLYIERELDGVTQMESAGDYKRERLPNSTQIERPIGYSSSKKKFIIKGYDTNNEELNELVKQCYLFNDIRSHHDYGKPIQEANVFNRKDPFFNHKALQLKLEEGYGSLNTEIPIEALMYRGIQVNNKFQVGGENSNPALNGRAKYIIVDSFIDKEVKQKQKTDRKTAEKLVENMSDAKKRVVALAMGLIRSEDTDIDIITDLLEDAAIDVRVDSNTKLTRQKYLIKVAESPNEELEARSYVNKAFQKGYIKRDKDSGSFLLFGNPIGREKQNVMDYLLSPVNSETLFKLQKAIDHGE